MKQNKKKDRKEARTETRERQDKDQKRDKDKTKTSTDQTRPERSKPNKVTQHTTTTAQHNTTQEQIKTRQREQNTKAKIQLLSHQGGPSLLNLDKTRTRKGKQLDWYAGLERQTQRQRQVQKDSSYRRKGT